MTFLGMPTAPRGVGQLRQEAPFPVAAARALEDSQLRRNLGHATSTIRAKRAAAVAEVPDWQELRAAGAAIKDDVLAHLDRTSSSWKSRSPRAVARCTGPATRTRRTGSSPT